MTSIKEAFKRNDAVGNEHTGQSVSYEEISKGVDEKRRGPGAAAICESLGIDEQELVAESEEQALAVVQESADINKGMFGIDVREHPMLLGMTLAISQSSHLQSFLAGARWMQEQERDGPSN